MTHILRPIARMVSDFPEKFGIPRQAGIVPELESVVVFEPEYRDPEALRGIEGFSHLWLIWQFSGSLTETFSPTVRPPRLGGNTRMGVFATRSPFRPNGLGLSCVELARAEERPGLGTVLIVPEAASGFAPDAGERLRVEIPETLLSKIPADKLSALRGVLANDPRPRYQNDPERVYAMDFAGMTVRFTVSGGTAQVREIV